MGRIRSWLRRLILVAVAAGLLLVGLRLLAGDRPGSGSGPTPLDATDYAVLAYSELGMHCTQPDYSAFFILPPYNNLRVQVFDRRNGGRPVTRGITVHYALVDNTTSADKINFWDYAAYYGYLLPPNVGPTGRGLQGTLDLDESGRYWAATGIPLVPYRDRPTLVDPYQLGVITVREAGTGRVLARLENVVLAVSDEMSCAGCHGHSDTWTKILNAHDRLSKTTLALDLRQGVRHRCNECHADPILDAPGRPDLPSLSQAVHGFHADHMRQSRIEPNCYNCHPGNVTRCNRGRMFRAGFRCNTPRCHGSMEEVAASIARGRRPWFGQPGCAKGGCHSPRFAENPGRLFKDSYLMNAPSPRMNGQILCGSCHNGPHAEWPSTVEADSRVPLAVVGHPGPIDRCGVCHAPPPGGAVSPWPFRRTRSPHHWGRP